MPGTGGTASETRSDAQGCFAFLSVPPGLYTVQARKAGAGAAEKKGLTVSDVSDIDLVFTLSPDARSALAGTAAKALDAAAVGAQTTITADQIDLLPSGNSIGSLLENQDLSATTNRIDVGGLWASSPVLYSARGGASWTQNSVLLNGLDVGDPFDGGQALWLPDVFSLASIGHLNAVLPARASGPGGQLNLTTRAGTRDFHASLRAFYTDRSLSADNISPALREEGLTENDRFSRAHEYDAQLSGPLSAGGATFFTAWSQRSLARDAAGFDPEDRSSLISGLFAADIPAAGNVLKLVGAVQSAGYDSYGAGRDVAWDATSRRSVRSGVLQILYETRPEGRSQSRFGFSWAASQTKDGLQAGADGLPRLDVFGGAASGAPASLDDSLRQKGVLSYDGVSLFPDLGQTDHRVEYGLQARYASASATTTVPQAVVLRYAGSAASEVAFSEPSYRTRQQSWQADAYLQDSITVAGWAGLRLGFNASLLSAGNGASSVRWLTVSPRAELTLPLSSRKTSTVKIALARYDFQLPLSALLWGDPNAPGALIYAWTDPNGDGVYQESERGALLRRQGPAYSALDPDLKRPRMDELAVMAAHDFGGGWRFTLSGFLRRTNRLWETINTGVGADAYTARTLTDAGDNRVPGDYDDLTFTVFDRRASALGQDFFLLTNPHPDERVSTYQGLDLTLVKAWDGRFLFYLSMTAMHIVGTTSPGNTEMENDDGVIGALYDDPNASINAEGRLRFDRAYTIRAGFSAPLPLGARLAVAAKYYDGQPFARKIVVEGLSQGLLYIQAHPRGVARYEFNMTVDARLEKSLPLGRGGSLRLLVDVFNLFNQSLATEESEWTSPAFPLRYATEVQSPRVVRAGLQVSF